MVQVSRQIKQRRDLLAEAMKNLIEVADRGAITEDEKRLKLDALVEEERLFHLKQDEDTQKAHASAWFYLTRAKYNGNRRAYLSARALQQTPAESGPPRWPYWLQKICGNTLLAMQASGTGEDQCAKPLHPHVQPL